MTRWTARLALAALVAAALSPAQAQVSGDLSLELNGAQPSEKGCRLTFVINNGLGSPLSKAAFEFALFSKSGVVDRITVLDFKDLAPGKTKVARFDLAGVSCPELGRILINTVTECTGDDVAPETCMQRLKPTTKTDITFGF